VVCEPFTQWVLEDRFGLGRPPLEDAGVQLVDDVDPYEAMKLRLLNAGHQGLAYLGHLAGHRLVHDAAQDPLFARFLLGYMEQEATPTLRPVPGIDLDHYRRDLIARFSNPAIRDTLARLAFDGSERLPKWLLPVVRENVASGGELRRSAAVVAGWARYCEGVDEEGQPIEVVDRRRDSLRERAVRQREDPLAFIADRELFGDLVDDERFTGPYTATLRSLYERGARATLEALVAELRPGGAPSATAAGTAPPG
jgi:mannitol 2-dehydrogenase